MSKFDLVVFDMAGTTIRDDDEVRACFQAVAEETDIKDILK